MHKRLYEPLKQYSINQKIKKTFLTIIIFIIAIMSLTVGTLYIFSKKTNSLYNQSHKMSDDIANMNISIEKIDNNLYKAIIETDKEKEDEYVKAAEEEVQIFRNNFTIIEEKFSGDKVFIENISKDFE